MSKRQHHFGVPLLKHWQTNKVLIIRRNDLLKKRIVRKFNQKADVKQWARLQS